MVGELATQHQKSTGILRGNLQIKNGVPQKDIFLDSRPAKHQILTPESQIAEYASLRTLRFGTLSQDGNSISV